MIQSFDDDGTEDIFNGIMSSAARRTLPVGLWRTAARRLDQLDSAVRLDDLRVPPGNHLEALRGDRAGQYSVRLNERYRVCFVWTERGPAKVEIVDYH